MLYIAFVPEIPGGSRRSEGRLLKGLWRLDYSGSGKVIGKQRVKIEWD